MTISTDTYKKVKSLIDESGKILVCTTGGASYDDYCALVGFFHYLKDLEKSVSVCIEGKLNARKKRLLDENEIDYRAELEPLNYVITLDHSDGDIEKVGWDDDDGKFRVLITPSPDGKGFDFDNVEYSYGGSDFELVFVFGVRSLKWLGNIYKENEFLFNSSTVVNINNFSGNQEFGDEKLVDSGVSVSEILFGLINSASTPSADKVVQYLLIGLLDYLQPMQRSDYKISSIETMTSLVKAGADFKRAMRNLYMSKDKKNFEVIQKLMTNLKIDRKAGVAWSGVSAFDMSQCNVRKYDLSLDGKIVFNIDKDMKVAFAMYEVENGEVWVEIESNDESINVKDIVSDSNPTGNTARATYVVKKKSMLEVEEEILGALKENLSVEKISPEGNDGDRVVNGQNSNLTDSDSSDNNNGEESDGSVQVVPPPVSVQP